MKKAYSLYSSFENTPNLDTIEAYLSEPIMIPDQIVTAGSVLQWWEMQRKVRPRLAAMAIAYLTAPGERITSLPSQTTHLTAWTIGSLIGRWGACIFRRPTECEPPTA